MVTKLFLESDKKSIFTTYINLIDFFKIVINVWKKITN